MNLLLLRDGDFLEDGTARVEGRRLEHARKILALSEGQTLRVGRLGGRMGTAVVLRCDQSELLLRVEGTLGEEPPERSGITLLLALPRPKALKKIFQAVAMLGVDRLVLVNAARVEKSYFASPVLREADDWFALGLEQARDTRAPALLVRERFRPFVEDEVDALFPARRLLAHPGAQGQLARTAEPVAIAVGPEGGWIPFEVELLESRGFRSFTLGPRILRVEVAVSFLLGALRG